MNNENRKNILIILGVVSGVVLLVSNLLATKIFSFFGIPMDAGVLVYPLTYIVGDLALMVAKEDDDRTPKTIIITSFAVNMLVAIMFFIAILLPAYPGWENQEAFQTIFGTAPRIIVGSLLGFLISNFINLKMFRKIDGNEVESEKLSFSKLFKKAFGSSAIAKVFDVFVFEFVAFIGILPIADFFLQAGFAYVVGMALEIPLSALTCFIYRKFLKNEI